MRPIAVSSPIVKLLEARFVLKLKKYMTEKLDRCQTGFVDNMGIQVNLRRVIKRIYERFSNDKVSYGLFIDFSNAYNCVPHSLLFQKLRNKQIFDEEELKFLEQLYTRYRLQIGKHRIRANRGVAQGSIISPYLFNIFVEDLAERLRNEAQLNIEDLSLYADDLLALCNSQAQLDKCVEIIEDWSAKNGMVLNKKKSVIVCFKKRSGRKDPILRKEVKEIPVLSKYKYLGTYLDNELKLDPQLAHIKKKSGYLFVKLYPYLVNASAEGRRDMWLTMVAPLFNAIWVLQAMEPSKTNRKKVEVIWKTTFKRFLMISMRTPSTLVHQMMREESRGDSNFYE